MNHFEDIPVKASDVCLSIRRLIVELKWHINDVSLKKITTSAINLDVCEDAITHLADARDSLIAAIGQLLAMRDFLRDNPDIDDDDENY